MGAGAEEHHQGFLVSTVQNLGGAVLRNNRMIRERMGIKPGDLIRCPDKATALWHRVVRVGRRRDGTRYVVIRRAKVWRALGLNGRQRIEWSALRALGYGLKRRVPKDDGTVTGTEAS